MVAFMPMGDPIRCTCGADQGTAGGTHSSSCDRSNAYGTTHTVGSWYPCNCQDQNTTFDNNHEPWCTSRTGNITAPGGGPNGSWEPARIPEPTSRHYRRRAEKLAREKPRLDKITKARLKKLQSRLV